MPLRSLLLMLCCQNPKFEDDLDSLNQFIKTMQESAQGMRASINAFQASAAEFQKAMTQQNSQNNNTAPFKNEANNYEQKWDNTKHDQEQPPDTSSSDTGIEEN